MERDILICGHILWLLLSISHGGDGRTEINKKEDDMGLRNELATEYMGIGGLSLQLGLSLMESNSISRDVVICYSCKLA